MMKPVHVAVVSVSLSLSSLVASAAPQVFPVTAASPRPDDLGGLSGLTYEPSTGTFWATTDNRTVASPSPVLFQLRLAAGAVEVLQRLPLRDELGQPVPTSPASPPPPSHPGLDPEGIDVAPDGTFWMVEEERQTLFHVSRDGAILSRHFAPGFSDATRTRGAGFEGVAVSPDGLTVYVAQQTPLAGEPATAPTYLLAFTPATDTWRTYRYTFESIAAQGYPTTGLGPPVRMGAHALEALGPDPEGNERLLVLERDNKSGVNARNKRLFEVVLPATSTSTPLPKTLVADLVASGYALEKPEGVAVAGPTVFVINDNSQGGNNAAGVPEPTELWVLEPLPPTLSFVGTFDAPALLTADPGQCTATVDNVNQRAGGCAAPDLVSCSFGGAASLALPLGSHDVWLEGVTSQGAWAVGESFVEVVDAEAPTHALAATPALLWPPNGAWWPIALTAPSDNCGAVSVACSVTADEALGDDVRWVDGALELRARRAGSGDGRVYTIACVATDVAGNPRATTTTVTVPHNR